MNKKAKQGKTSLFLKNNKKAIKLNQDGLNVSFWKRKRNNRIFKNQ